MLSIEKLEGLNKYRISQENANKTKLTVGDDTEELINKVLPINIQRRKTNFVPPDIVQMVDKETQTD